MEIYRPLNIDGKALNCSKIVGCEQQLNESFDLMLPRHTQLPKSSNLGRSVEELRLAGVLPRRAVARLSLLGEGGEARCTTGDHESIITTARRVPPYYRAVEALSLSGKMPTDICTYFLLVSELFAGA